MSTGDKIRKRREALGLSQGELAKKVGVSQPMINQIEWGRKSPTMKLGTRIADALGCTLDDIAEWEERK